MKTLLYGLGGVLVLVISFGLALFLIDNWPKLSGSDLDAAMKSAGYSSADVIQYSLDNAKRDYEGKIAISGWAVDTELGKPVKIFIFVQHAFVPITTTKGPRPDVAKALHLPPERATDIVFNGRTDQPVDCKLLEQAPIVAVNEKGHLVKMVDGLHIPSCR